MSYDVSLRDAETGAILTTDSHTEGGTIVVGGTNECVLNITYNYSEVYSMVTVFVDHQPTTFWRKVGMLMSHDFGRDSYFSIKLLHGRKAKGTVPWLTKVVRLLGDKPYEDYWAPTPGNAGHAAAVLLKWALEHPEGVWDVC